MDIFSTRLNQQIKENRITKYRVAKDLGCSKQSVCNWCDGISEPTISYLRKLALYFDVTSDYLLGLEDETGAKIEITGQINLLKHSKTYYEKNNFSDEFMQKQMDLVKFDV